MRRDKSFADDLVVRQGRVSSRVALLLRATERKPSSARFVADAFASPLTSSASRAVERDVLTVRGFDPAQVVIVRMTGPHRALWGSRAGVYESCA